MSEILLNADSYKGSHFKQTPQGTEHISSYIEPRGGYSDRVMFFGLQMELIENMMGQLDLDDVLEAEAFYRSHGVPFNVKGALDVLNRHDGHLPIEIQALPEGMIVPVRTPMVQVVNTDSEAAWLTSYLETGLLRAVWYPSSVATLSWHCKQILRRYLELTSDDPEGQLPFKLHDFGARGATCREAAGLGGCAHLVNFMGSDTITGIRYARKYYGEPMAGFSIPAAEHSTITSWGREGETDAYRNMIEQFGGPGKIFAVVSDSYDLFNAIDNIWGGTLYNEVVNNGGTLVIRPDSGIPEDIVVEVLRRLTARFGYHINSKGYAVLPPYIRVIQGDGINRNAFEKILDPVVAEKISTENVAFGMGGKLLQGVDRDTHGWAMKASAAQVNGHWRDVYKDPITDPGKASKRGRLAVTSWGHNPVDHKVETVPMHLCAKEDNLLKPVWRNGKLLVRHSFAEIRERANKYR